MSSTSLPWSRKYSAIGGGDERAARAHQRRLVAGRDDHHRARQPFGAERVLDEVAHLAAALAEQRDHVDVGLRLAGDHAEQRALADAASRRRCRCAGRGRS